MELETKICITCKKDKYLYEYYSKIKKDGSIYYRLECKNCVTKRTKQWRENNPEKYKKIMNKVEARPDRIKYMKEKGIRQKASGYTLLWRKSNPDKVKVYNELHENHKISTKEWNSCKDYFNNECAYCGLKLEDHYFTRLGITKNGDFHKDHLIHDGGNYLDNCIPACKSCNCSKHTASLESWYNIHNKNFTQTRYNKIIKWSTEDYRNYLKPRKELVLI